MNYTEDVLCFGWITAKIMTNSEDRNHEMLMRQNGDLDDVTNWGFPQVMLLPRMAKGLYVTHLTC